MFTFGIGTRRHIRRFLRWPIDGVPIGDLVRSRIAIYCQADPEHARTWLQPVVEGLRLSTNDTVAAISRQEE